MLQNAVKSSRPTSHGNLEQDFIVSETLSVSIMRGMSVCETLDSCSELTQLVTREDFITFNHCKNFKSCMLQNVNMGLCLDRLASSVFILVL
jgi:hypothetical protein